MTIRELPPEEWARLDAHEGLDGKPLPLPGAAIIMVAEDEAGQITGFHITQAAVHFHAEPLYVAPEYRGTPLAYRLFQASLATLDPATTPAVYCFASSPEVATYLEQMGGTPQPFLPFLLWLPSSDSDAPAVKKLPPLLDPPPSLNNPTSPNR